MAKESQISAEISDSTRDLMERYVRHSGVKKGHLIEQALLHHLKALDELPLDFIVHPRFVVDRKTAEKLLRGKRKPSRALRELMSDGD